MEDLLYTPYTYSIQNVQIPLEWTKKRIIIHDDVYDYTVYDDAHMPREYEVIIFLVSLSAFLYIHFQFNKRLIWRI
jgi:hypothetical protein